MKKAETEERRESQKRKERKKKRKIVMKEEGGGEGKDKKGKSIVGKQRLKKTEKCLRKLNK